MTDYLVDVPWHINVYHDELNLNRMRLRLALDGIEMPDIKNACELGFGNGSNINVNAASFSQTKWFGTDINSRHFNFAKSFSSKMETPPSLENLTFAEFSETSLPKFDLIAMMGCWSWISQSERSIVLDFVSKKLNPGGIFVFNYITHPGQTHFAAFRQFILDCAHSSEEYRLNKTDRFLKPMQFVAEVMELNPWYLRANPDIAEFLNQHLETSSELFGHEYLNENWQPMSFAEVSKLLNKIDMTFACETSFNEYGDAIHLDERQKAFLSKIEDTALRQTSSDFIRMRSHRCDYWIKQPKALSSDERLSLIQDIALTLIKPMSEFSTVLEGTLGNFELDKEEYEAVLEKIAATKSVVISDLLVDEVETEKLVRILAILIHQKMIAPTPLINTENLEQVNDCQTLNQTMLHDEAFADISILACPGLGGLKLDPITKSFVAAYTLGAQDADMLCRKALSAASKDADLRDLKAKADEFLAFYPRFLTEHSILAVGNNAT